MAERLIIKNFGPIKDVDLTFGRFNVLIGEQATGKSTVLKLLAVCRYFSYIINVLPSQKNPFTEGLWDWGLLEFREENSYINYICEDYQLTYYSVPEIIFESKNSIRRPGLFDFKLTNPSERFKTLLSELSELQQENKGVPYTFFKTSVAQVMQNPLFLGTERDSNFLDFPTSSLKGSIENSEKLRQIKNRLFGEVAIDPLGISYRTEGNDPLIKKKGETAFHKLSNSASGYQSAIPIVLSMKSYSNPPDFPVSFPIVFSKPKTFIIEEPELNLFPIAQYELMKFLVDKTMNFGNKMFLATHSPYVLSSLNTLMNAFQSGQKDAIATEKIIPKEFWLNPDEVSAYFLKPDGTCECIIDSEEKMIKSEKIDEASSILNRDFNDLLNIQFGIANEES
ncbi:MAG: AAA family ATPase [Chitinophagaceae bacterium]